MVAARAFFTFAIVPLALLAAAAQTPPEQRYSRERAMARVANPSGCNGESISAAIERQLVPNFIGCMLSDATTYANRVNLKLDARRRPDKHPSGMIFNQRPRGGSSPPDNRTIAVLVSTGPAPTPPPEEAPITPPPIKTRPPPPIYQPPQPPKTVPGPVMSVRLTGDTALAGNPLRFAISMRPGSDGGRVSYETVGGSAVPMLDYRPVRGNVTLNPSGPPIVVSVDTRPRSSAPDEAAVLMIVRDGDRILARAAGRIRQPPPVVEEPPAPPVAPPPTQTCPNGKIIPATETCPTPPPTPTEQPTGPKGPEQPPLGKPPVQPQPPPPLTQTCPNGQVIPATDSCPKPFGSIDFKGDTVIAGNPLRFTVSVTNGAGGKVFYLPTGGSARADVDYTAARGGLVLDRSSSPQVISVDTKPDPGAAGDLTVIMTVRGGNQIKTAVGIIRQPPPSPAPCPDGTQPPCRPVSPPAPPPSQTCADGSQPPCTVEPRPCPDGTKPPCGDHRTWWDQVRDTLAGLPGWVLVVAGIVLGGGAVYVARTIWPRNGKTGNGSPEDAPEIAVRTSYPTHAVAPKLTSSGKGPKSPIVSLIVKTTCGVPQATRSTPSTESKDV